MQRLSRRLLIGFVSSVIALGLAEAGFRALLTARFERALAAFEHDLWVTETGTRHLYSLRPAVTNENRVSPEADAWRWTCTTDSAGRRVTKNGDPTNGPRVVALGDSYTFGWGVEDDEAYPSQMERLLRADPELVDVQVINAGMPGFNTMQEASYLASRWEELQPDVVVLGFVMNDAEPTRIVPRDPRLRFEDASLWLLEELQLRTGWTDGWLASRAHRQREYPLQFAEGAPEGARCRRSLEAIKRLCAEHSVPLLLVILPDMTALPAERGGSYRYAEIHRTVGRWAGELGLQAVDLLPLFEGVDRGVMQVPGDGHPSALALRTFAEAIAAPVAEALR